MDRLLPEAGAVVCRQLLEGEVEDFRERGGRVGRTSSTASDRPSSAERVVNSAPSSPHAVIHSVKGAASRSTFSA